MANYYTGLDPYFLYFSCYLDQPDGTNPLSNTNKIPKYSKNSIDFQIKHLKRRFGKFDNNQTNPLPACSHYDDMVTWLNRRDVKSAIHVPLMVQNYATCSTDVEAHYVTEIDDVSPFVLDAIQSNRLKIVFFNGDVDSVCNVVHNSQV
uniref:Serine carboxypeptidase n=1 Tax=Panagrolaimus sp. JU765 TaxID=591449 RepID=A0AC34QV95_9BILA